MNHFAACRFSLPCPRPAASRPGKLRHPRTVAVGAEQASESRKTPENSFVGNPDYSALLLVGRLRGKRSTYFQVAGSPSDTSPPVPAQGVFVSASLISLFNDVGNWSLEARPPYWFHPSITVVLC